MPTILLEPSVIIKNIILKNKRDLLFLSEEGKGRKDVSGKDLRK